ncbi:MAG: hypothetical protein CMO01_09755 [Thalassobius sp.]|nr:hypothetical protein [Thalassovita sp.]
MEISEFKKAFRHKPIPEILIGLLNFTNTIAIDDWFSQGFEFEVDEENYMLKTYSLEEEFLTSLIPFALADGTGSVYAFWLKNKENSLENTPIVAFGSEGGYHIISESIDDLLKILTFDTEVYVDHDDVSYFKSEDDEPSKFIKEYQNWLLENYQISATNNPDEIVQKAREKYQKEFEKWMNKFLS